MSEKLSSWIDGELDTQEAEAMLASEVKKRAFRNSCKAYWAIGDSLREEPELSVDFTDRVMAALEDEPTVFSPASIRATEPVRKASTTWLSLAAAVSGVMVVGFVVSSFQKNEADSQSLGSIASTESYGVETDSPVKPAVAQSNSDLSGDRAYVVAHRPYSGVGGVTPGVAIHTQQVEDKQQTESGK